MNLTYTYEVYANSMEFFDRFPEKYSGRDKKIITKMLWGRREDLAWSSALKDKMNRTSPYGGWVKNARHRIFLNNFRVKDTDTCEGTVS